MNQKLHSSRKDWTGRTPRWRVSMDDARFGRLIEAFEGYLSYKGLWDDPRYTEDLRLLKEARAKLATPLVTREDSSFMPLFESDFDI